MKNKRSYREVGFRRDSSGNARFDSGDDFDFGLIARGCLYTFGFFLWGFGLFLFKDVFWVISYITLTIGLMAFVYWKV